MTTRRYTTTRQTIVTVEPLAPAPVSTPRGGRARRFTPPDAVIRSPKLTTPPTAKPPARLDLIAPPGVADAEVIFVEGFMPSGLARQLAALVEHYRAA